MAALTRSELREIRAYVGADEPSDQELQERFDDLGGTTLEVARQVLQERHGGLTAGPEVWSAEGDYREENKVVISTLEQQIADLSLLIDGHTIPGYDPDDTAEAAALTRGDRERLYWK